MSTDIPATVTADEVTSWSDDVDVVVLGFGIAGGCAAVSAAAAGANVLVLERAAAAGGTSSMAGGHFYLGGGTAVQQATGHDDSPEEMYKYLVAVSREPELDKIRAYCDGSVEHFNWLEDLGFQFERSYLPRQGGRPAGHRRTVVHRQRKGVAVLRAGDTRAARDTRCRCPANWVARRWSSTCCSSGPPSWGCRSAMRPERPTSSSTTVRWSASRGSTSPKPVRSRRMR